MNKSDMVLMDKRELEKARECWKIVNIMIPAVIDMVEFKMLKPKEALKQIEELVK